MNAYSLPHFIFDNLLVRAGDGAIYFIFDRELAARKESLVLLERGVLATARAIEAGDIEFPSEELYGVAVRSSKPKMVLKHRLIAGKPVVEIFERD